MRIISFREFKKMAENGTFDRMKTGVVPGSVDACEATLNVLIRLVCEFDTYDCNSKRNTGFKLRALKKILQAEINEGMTKIRLGNNPMPDIDQELIVGFTDKSMLLGWIKETYKDIIFYTKLKR